MNIPIPAETPDPNIDDPVLPPGDTEPPVKDPNPIGDPPCEDAPMKI